VPGSLDRRLLINPLGRPRPARHGGVRVVGMDRDLFAYFPRVDIWIGCRPVWSSLERLPYSRRCSLPLSFGAGASTSGLPQRARGDCLIRAGPGGGAGLAQRFARAVWRRNRSPALAMIAVRAASSYSVVWGEYFGIGSMSGRGEERGARWSPFRPRGAIYPRDAEQCTWQAAHMAYGSEEEHGRFAAAARRIGCPRCPSHYRNSKRVRRRAIGAHSAAPASVTIEPTSSPRSPCNSERRFRFSSRPSRPLRAYARSGVMSRDEFAPNSRSDHAAHSIGAGAGRVFDKKSLLGRGSQGGHYRP